MINQVHTELPKVTLGEKVLLVTHLLKMLNVSLEKPPIVTAQARPLFFKNPPDVTTVILSDLTLGQTRRGSPVKDK